MKWKKKRKFWNDCRIHLINIVDISRKTDEKNGVEAIVGNDGILWLNEKHIKEGLYSGINETKQRELELLGSCLRNHWANL